MRAHFMMSRDRPIEIPFVFFVVSCLIGAELGQLIVIPIGRINLPAVWPLVGVLLGALILTEPRRWTPLVLTASGAMLVSTSVLHGQPTFPSIGLAVIAGCEVSAVAWLVQRTTEGPFALNRVAHTGALVVASALVPITGGVLASLVLVLSNLSGFFAAWRAWWFADALGMLVIAPLAVTAMTERAAIMSIVRSWKAIEILIVFAGGVIVAASIFGEALDPLLSVPAYVLPFLLWPVFRFGPGGTSAAIFIVSLIGLWNAAHGHGPLALTGATAANIVLRSQGALAIAAVSLVLLASVVAERKRVTQEHAVLVAELQKALAEVKTLRGFIPICAWCHKVRDDAGFWQQIEMYLDARTDATFSHSICPACTAEAHDEIAAHARGVQLPPAP